MSATSEKCSQAGSEIRVGFYCIGKTIGKGNSAIVKRAKHSITKSDVAIKIIDKSLFDNGLILDKIRREIKILKFLKHPNIVKLYQVMESDKFIYLVSEYAANGEIFDYISKHGRFSEAEAKIKFSQILNAVDYCHQMGIVHRDLKTENLLLDDNFNVKLADFGFGNFYSKDSKLSTWCGSPPYAAPEIFEGRTYCGPEVDIWSLGVILYVLVCGQLPFDGENLRIIRDQVVIGRFRIPFFMSMDCERLIRKILVVDPKKRYTMQQIKQHEWIRDTLSSTHSQSLEESFSEQLVVTGRGISMNCHDIVLQKMENAKISKEQVLKSLENQAYDNFTAIYELLLDKIAQKIKKCPLSRLEAAGLRRPSMISEQAIMSVKHQSTIPSCDSSPVEIKTPGLAETREAVFSQTTDGVQLHEVSGPLCQLQQRIKTDEYSNEMTSNSNTVSTITGGGVLVMPASPVRSKLVRSTRLGINPSFCRVKQMQLVGQPTQIASSSIDEGVETELEMEDCKIIPQVEHRTIIAPFGTSVNYNKETQLPCKPSISIDSNIEVDLAGSDLSLSSPASWINFSNNFIDNSTNAPACLEPHSDISNAHYDQLQSAISTSNTVDKETLSSFKSGRRGSDGLAAKGEFIKPSTTLLKQRVCGVAELRKELVKLQNETMDSLQQQSPLINYNIENTNNPMSHCNKQKYLMRDQRSLEESLLSKNSGPKMFQSCTIKRTLPYNRQTHLISPMECPGLLPRPHSPLRGAIKRQLGPMRSVPHHQHHHYVYGQPSNTLSGHHYNVEYFSSASNSPTRGGKVYSTLSGSPMCINHLNHQSFDSSCRPLGNLQQSLEKNNNDENISNQITNLPLDNISFVNSNLIYNKAIPVCHSHSNLLPNIIYNSPTRCRYNVPSSLSTTSSTSSSPLPGPQSNYIVSNDDALIQEDLAAGISNKHINIAISDNESNSLPISVVRFESFDNPSGKKTQIFDKNRTATDDLDIHTAVDNIGFCSRDNDNTEDIINENKRHIERRIRFGMVQQQQVCGSEEEMMTSLANSPNDEIKTSSSVNTKNSE